MYFYSYKIVNISHIANIGFDNSYHCVQSCKMVHESVNVINLRILLEAFGLFVEMFVFSYFIINPYN
jgi:hypothetical protein